jgi:(2Fe-2S) ferredoxin
LIEPFRRHVFVCVNKRDDGRPSCGDHDAKDALAFAKARVKELPFAERDGVRASQSGCLGQCQHGPVGVVYPAGDWFRYASPDDLARIITEAVSRRDERD